MTGIFHSPDGRVITTQAGPVIGNNIVFNIINSYSIAPNNLPNKSDTTSAAPVLSRKLQNQASLQPPGDSSGTFPTSESYRIPSCVQQAEDEGPGTASAHTGTAKKRKEDEAG